MVGIHEKLLVCLHVYGIVCSEVDGSPSHRCREDELPNPGCETPSLLPPPSKPPHPARDPEVNFPEDKERGRGGRGEEYWEKRKRRKREQRRPLKSEEKKECRKVQAEN